MVSREAQAAYPQNEFINKQFSSYSRKAVSPTNGWFSNWDWSNFLRIEQNAGRTEYVMFEDNGPGAVVRWWMTFAKKGHNSYIRVYIDGNETPVLEGNPIDLLGENKAAGFPMSSSSSYDSPRTNRGHNLYFPIPYAKSCKITIESNTLTGNINDKGQAEGSFIFYNINYRDYADTVKVESFKASDFTEQATLIKEVNDTLLKPMPEQELTKTTLNKTIEPNTTASVNLSGEKAIKQLTVKLAAEDLNQALRSTVLEVTFDGKETIWVPVGDFFGTGYKVSPYKSWYTEVTKDGSLASSFVMPFAENAEVSFVNFGEQPVTIDATIATEPYTWTEDSLYFHASWFELNRVKVTGNPGENHAGHGASDVNFVTIEGKGSLIGDSLTLFDGAREWWGEGDEKIYVDGETFPSHFGTGTEDYYGYAWCRNEPFHTPFITQPDGSGNLSEGFTVNSRYRLLDQLTFTKSLRFDMELWHWATTTMNYAPAVFYYATKESTSNATQNIKNVKAKVVLDTAEILPPKNPALTKG
ncbi:glycoside hydrolase family 172 protein [Endozoicomonas sp. SESOKO1]|uniref:glycoside hydrolase family 172 protein n=1 Tax=Endozoicomonas sp. SESOKO1 TaxID=2828742 RepID=UPI00214919EF|nr:glycoside hydrolase family 172 protein [Endozoicomonas sp. SESOKO1]